MDNEKRVGKRKKEKKKTRNADFYIPSSQPFRIYMLRICCQKVSTVNTRLKVAFTLKIVITECDSFSSKGLSNAG
jgi:hypothetical protein